MGIAIDPVATQRQVDPVWRAYRRLSAAVLKRAALDARKGDGDAASWLLSGDSDVFLDALGLDSKQVASYVGDLWCDGLVKM